MESLQASSRQLTGSLKSSLSSTDRRQALAKADEARQATASYSADRARLLFGQFRKGDANDPETYVASIAAMFAEYPGDVVKLATDPRTGLAAGQDFLPTVKEVREFCEGIVNARAERKRRDQELERQLAERQRYEAVRETAPTRAELIARGVLREEPIAALPAADLARIVMAKQKEFGTLVRPDADSIAILRAGGYGIDAQGLVTTPQQQAAE